MSQLLKHALILTLIAPIFQTLGACRQGAQPSRSAPAGNVLSNAMLDTVPLRVVCRRLENLLADETLYDLTLERQLDATYNAYIHKPRFGVKKGQHDVALTRLGYAVDLYLAGQLRPKKYIVFDNLLTDFRFNYIKENNADTVHSTLEGDFWTKSLPDGEQLYCEELNQLAPDRPKLDDRLYVVGAVRNPETKVQEKITLAIKVDALLQVDGKEAMLSLTNNLPWGQLPLKAPVYNRQHELVGYVLANRPGAVAGITIASIHDPKLGPQLAKLTRQSAWKPKPPVEPALSRRFQDLICSRIFTQSQRGCDDDSGLLAALWNACGRKASLVSDSPRAP